MADEPQTTAEETQPAGGDRMDRLESKVDKLADAVSRLLPGSHAEAEERTEAKLDRSSDVQEQVRAELARAKAEEDRKRQEEAAASEHSELKETVRKLTERPPEPPTPRRTKLLGWGS